jgi:hypothetical protein
MARNYVDVPILVLKVKAASACTTGCILKSVDSSGFADATAVATACGVYAMESQSDTGYLTAMIVGTFWATTVDTIEPGAPFQWSAAAGVIDSCSDTMSLAIGTMIDPADSSTDGTTRGHRALIYGTPVHKGVWNA